jgi:hypothetical protein
MSINPLTKFKTLITANESAVQENTFLARDQLRTSKLAAKIRRPIFQALSLHIVVLFLISGCAGTATTKPRSEVTLPLNHAWVDGQRVEYVTTDISDQTMAKALGVNFVPRLADALPTGGQRSLVERVYKFTDDSQITVFQSAPLPTGAENKDKSYSPLWRMVMVRWNAPNTARELKSEEEVLAATDSGELSLEVTGIVINCPITRSVDGLPIKGVH